MQQHEVIQEALRNAPSSPAAINPPAKPGEKVIDPADLGDVDVAVITAWVQANGGRGARPTSVDEATGGEEPAAAAATAPPLWVIPEAALDL